MDIFLKSVSALNDGVRELFNRCITLEKVVNKDKVLSVYEVLAFIKI